MSTIVRGIGIGIFALGLLLIDPVEAQLAPGPTTPEAHALAVGERMEYGLKFGRLRLGKASLEVEARDDQRGELGYRVALDVSLGAPILRFEDRLVSWIAPDPFRSLAFERRDPDDKSQRVRHEFEEDALDELATLYYLRTLGLEPGFDLETDRYFSPAGNPMRFRVVGRERVRVPAGRFDTIVLEPVIPALGIFKREAEARLYLSDDEWRILVQVETTTKAGRLTIYLTDYDRGGSE